MERLPTWAQRAIFIGVGAVFFFIGLLVLMPGKFVAEIVEAQVERATGFKLDAEVEHAGVRGLTGVRARGIDLAARPQPEGLPPRNARIEHLRASAGLFSLIGGKPNIRGRIEFTSGHLDADVSLNGAERSLDLRLFDVALGPLSILQQYTRVPIRGTLRGTVSVATDDDGRLSSGAIDLNLLSSSVGPLVIGPEALPADMRRFYDGSIEIPAMRTGDLLVRGEINGPAFELTELSSQGEDLRTNGEGQILLRSPLATSELQLNARIAIEPSWVEEAGIGGLLGEIPQIQQAQSGDEMVFALTGQLRRPRIVPSGSRRRL